MRVRSAVPLLVLGVLAAAPSPASADTEPNSWLLGAEELPLNVSTMTGTVGPGDELDFYTFAVAKFQEIELLPDVDDGCPDMSLADDEGRLFQQRMQIYDDERQRVFVRVRFNKNQCSGNQAYSFQIRAINRVSQPPLPTMTRETEPNDTPETAEIPQNGVWYRGKTDDGTDADYYRFWVPPGAHTLKVQTVGLNERENGFEPENREMLSYLDSPSLAAQRDQYQDPWWSTYFNNREVRTPTVYGPEAVTMWMPRTSESQSWAFSISADPGVMLNAPYVGPTPPGNPTPPPPDPPITVPAGGLPPDTPPNPGPGKAPPIENANNDVPAVPAPVAQADQRPAGASVARPMRCRPTTTQPRRGRPMVVTCTAVPDGTRMRVTWTRGRSTAGRSIKVRRNRAAVVTPRLAKGTYVARLTIGEERVGRAVVSLR